MTKQDSVSAPLPRLGEMGMENYAPYLMNRIMARYNAALKEEMAALGLTTPQMRALAVLSVVNGILIRELAVYAVVPQSTLSRALDALVRDGLIRRETDASDSRAVQVFITDMGREANDRLWPHMAQANAAMFWGIPDEERSGFTRTLQTMMRNIRKHNF
ncbi:MarR family winged helix-turn-helix transcriptional regulator [Loktanella sp. DJP18]|uniref:MarR family winged helix-turn-helix transcriptional regulator n=1 Tax=Loktanella sp. DJP18 TaxID=3409788 RepID=UPI003BB4FB6F